MRGIMRVRQLNMGDGVTGTCSGDIYASKSELARTFFLRKWGQVLLYIDGWLV